jgi:hypothetical protein
MSMMPALSRPNTTRAAASRSSCRGARSPAWRRGALEGALDQLLAAWVSTWMVTSSGISVLLDELAARSRSRSAGAREADLDLLVAHPHQQVEHPRLRSGLIGSIRAWLPSRRSTAHQRGPGDALGPARCGRVDTGRRAQVTVTLPAAPHRQIHDAKHGTRLPGALVRTEGDAAVTDVSVNEAYDGLGATWQLLWDGLPARFPRRQGPVPRRDGAL